MTTTFFTKAKLTECVGLTTPCPWDAVYIELVYSPSGTVHAYTRGDKLPFCADGYGYDKNGVVLAQFLNYWHGSNICRNTGQGDAQVIDCAYQHGYKITYVTDTKSGKLFRFAKIGV